MLGFSPFLEKFFSEITGRISDTSLGLTVSILYKTLELDKKKREICIHDPAVDLLPKLGTLKKFGYIEKKHLEKKNSRHWLIKIFFKEKTPSIRRTLHKTCTLVPQDTTARSTIRHSNHSSELRKIKVASHKQCDHSPYSLKEDIHEPTN